MLKKTLFLFVLATSIQANDAQDAEAADGILTQPITEAIEEVVVTGRRPGPPLWRATHDGHTLWIFGTLLPIPKSFEWDADSIRHIIRTSTAFIEPPKISASTSNPFRGIRLVRQIHRAKQLPSGSTLETALSTEEYARYQLVKNRYAPRAKSLENLRPLFVSDELMERALDSVGLSNKERVYKKLRRLAKRHDLTMHSAAVEVDVERIADVLRHSNPAAERRCLATALETIETDLMASIERAVAWSAGDAAALKALDYPDAEAECNSTLFEVPLIHQARQTSRNNWLDLAESALRTNESTLASLPIKEIVQPDGLLAQLAMRGYEIRGQ